jgi:hypothetical protein
MLDSVGYALQSSAIFLLLNTKRDVQPFHVEPSSVSKIILGHSSLALRVALEQSEGQSRLGFQQESAYDDSRGL